MENNIFSKIVKLTKNGEYLATYNNHYSAAIRNGIKPRRILNCCKGKKNSTGGFKWVYQNDYQINNNKDSVLGTSLLAIY